jgi:hypothetical protein
MTDNPEFKLEEIKCPLCDGKREFEHKTCRLCNGFGVICRFVDVVLEIDKLDRTVNWAKC